MTAQGPADASKWTTSGLWILVSLAILLVVRELHFVLVPLVVAFIVALMANPLLVRLERHLPGWFGMVIVLSLVLFVIAGMAWAFTQSIAALGSRIDTYESRIQDLLVSIDTYTERFGLHVSQNQVDPQQWLTLLTSGVQSALSTVVFLGFLFFVLALLLLELTIFRRKVYNALAPHVADTVMEVLESLSTGLRTYFRVYLLLSLLTGTCTALFLWALGVDFPLVWGLLAFTLNFIPNIGSIIAVAPPVAIGFLQFDGLAHGFVVLVGLAVIQNVIGSYLGPRLLGVTISLSPLVVLLCVLFWGWFWGAAGLFLAVPLTLGMRLACERVPALRPIAVFLSNGDKLPDPDVEGPALRKSGAIDSLSKPDEPESSEG